VITMTELTDQELAEIERRFEEFDDTTGTTYEAGDPNTPAPVLLTQALAARDYYASRADQVMREAVDTARRQGLSWHKIGLRLGVTGEAARQRYAHA
jgi:6-phosphogluconate dehydrogenase (decarboxylating)